MVKKQCFRNDKVNLKLLSHKVLKGGTCSLSSTEQLHRNAQRSTESEQIMPTTKMLMLNSRMEITFPKNKIVKKE